MNSKKTKTTTEYIELIASDYQFDKSHPDYHGFINIDPQEMVDSRNEYAEAAMKIAMNPDNFEAIANKHGLTIESAWEEELIFAEINQN